jgi:hypothetical protein
MPGVCYYLYTSFAHKRLKEYHEPEILRIRLEELCLQVKVRALNWLPKFLLLDGNCDCYVGSIFERIYCSEAIGYHGNSLATMAMLGLCMVWYLTIIIWISYLLVRTQHRHIWSLYSDPGWWPPMKTNSFCTVPLFALYFPFKEPHWHDHTGTRTATTAVIVPN